MRTTDSYPALAQFAAGYLHQDFVLEHRTPAGAREAFLRDATARERASFFKDASRFLADFEQQGWTDMRDAFARLGAAWHPTSRRALTALLTADPEDPAGRPRAR